MTGYMQDDRTVIRGRNFEVFFSTAIAITFMQFVIVVNFFSPEGKVGQIGRNFRHTQYQR
jgi:hypothetical protein